MLYTIHNIITLEAVFPKYSAVNFTPRLVSGLVISAIFRSAN